MLWQQCGPASSSLHTYCISGVFWSRINKPISNSVGVTGSNWVLPLLGGVGGVRGTMFLTAGVRNGRRDSGVAGSGRGCAGGV